MTETDDQSYESNQGSHPGQTIHVPPLASAGRNAGSVFRSWWAVLTRPRVATFDSEIQQGSWKRIWIGLCLLAIANVVFDYLAGIETGHAVMSVAITSALALIIGFFVFAGIWYVIGRWSGGRGGLMRYVYVLSLVIVPCGIGTELAQLVPPVSGLNIAGLLAASITVYELYLLILATASALRLGIFKAGAAFLAPFVVIALVWIVSRPH